jgi:hypothetical protein
MMLPSFEGRVLVSAAANSATSARPTLAFMVVGSTFVTRVAMERLYGADFDGDKDIHVHVNPLDHTTCVHLSTFETSDVGVNIVNVIFVAQPCYCFFILFLVR